MSEAFLYALDAPNLADTARAADLVEHWRDSRDSPTAGIASFFESLLQMWPEDGSKGEIWYEDFSKNKPAGPMLEITVNLNEFDEERLAQLRNLVQKHGIHEFDPEGGVLYLADGSEVVG